MFNEEAKIVLNWVQNYDVALISVWDETLSDDENKIRMGGLLRNLWFLITRHPYEQIACLGTDSNPQTKEDKYLITNSTILFQYLWDLFSSCGIPFLCKSKYSDNFYSVGTDSQRDDYKRQTKVGDINQVLLPLVERGVHIYTDGSKKKRVEFINNSVFSKEEKAYCSRLPRVGKFYYTRKSFTLCSSRLFQDFIASLVDIEPIIEHPDRQQAVEHEERERRQIAERESYQKRITRWCQKYDTAVISAWRAKLENINAPSRTLRKTKKAQSNTQPLPTGYIFNEEENNDRRHKLDVLLQADKFFVVYLGHDNLSPNKEEKYLVINRFNNENFFSTLFALSEWFNQDYFLYKPQDKTCFYVVGTNASSNPGYEQVIKWGDVTKLLPSFIDNNIRLENPNPETCIPHPSLLNPSAYREYVAATDHGKLRGYRIIKDPLFLFST